MATRERGDAPLVTARALSALVGVWLALLSVGWLASASGVDDAAARLAAPYGQLFESVVALVRSAYWDPEHLDWDDWAETFRDAALASPDRAAFDVAMSRMLRALGDDHSRWSGLEPAAAAAPAVDPPLGIGCACVFIPGRGLLIERVYAGTPAAAAGLLRGDVVVVVGGVSLAAAGTTSAASEQLRTALEQAALEQGSVTLSIERRRLGLEVAIEGERLSVAEVSARPYATLLDATTAYLWVPSFQGMGVAAQAHAALAATQAAGAVGLVLDLRGNPGGRLLEAGGLLAAFLDGAWADGVSRGAVAWSAEATRTAASATSRLVAPSGEDMARLDVAEGVRWEGPVVVVVDRATTSVAEVVASALQRVGRASVVGVATPGNVEAVQGFTLSDGSRLFLAVAELRAPDGASYASGVLPDVPSSADRAALAQGRDLPLLEARRLLGGLPFVPDRRF